MLRERIIQTVAAESGISLVHLRSVFPNTPFHRIRNTVWELRDAGALESSGDGKLRIPTPAPPPQLIEQSSFIRPPTIERLMGRR